MTTSDFRTAVDEIKMNGGTRQTMHVKEIWRDRCMTIFGYSDGTAEVYAETDQFMAFGSVAEAVAFVAQMQIDYDRKVAEDRRRRDSRRSSIKVDSYMTPADWYRNAPRGTYFGD